MQFFGEATELSQHMKAAFYSAEYISLQNQWIEKVAQARAEIEKAIEIRNQFIQELERRKNRNLN